MAKAEQIKIILPELMSDRGISKMDLVRKAGISYPTALRLAKGEANAITFQTLANLCEMFEVEVGDLIVYDPE